MMSWNKRPVIITVAPTGAEVTRNENPNVPYSPSEIASSVCASAQAGAAVAHLHVREQDGSPSGSAVLFGDTIDLIRESCSLITMVSTGGAVWMGMEDRAAGLRAAPELAGIETGSLNFGDEAFVTTRPQMHELIEAAIQAGIGLEVEAFEVGHVYEAVQMVQRGELPVPLRVNLVFGVPGGIDASPEALIAMLRPLPPDTPWTVTAIGRSQPRMLALALLYGAWGIRVGFEDGVYLRRGVLADSNAQLVDQAALLIGLLGRKVATPSQARELLALPPDGLASS